MIELIFIAISFLGGIFCIFLLRGYDLYEKEPWWKLVLTTFWGGTWSVVFALTIYSGLAWLGIKSEATALHAFLVIGPVEELSKLLAFGATYFIIKDELNEPADGMIYMACVALGFSLVENYWYALHPNSEYLILVRLLICTPVHIMFSVFMGLTFYIWRQNQKAWRLFIASYLMASALHGLYDAMAFNILGYLVLMLINITVFLGNAYSWTMNLLSYASALSPHRMTLRQFIETYENPPLMAGMKCPYCGSSAAKMTYRLGRIKIQKCDACQYYLIRNQGLRHIFRYFAGMFSKPEKIIASPDFNNPHLASVYTGTKIRHKKAVITFELESLSQSLIDLHSYLVGALERKWWFPTEHLDRDGASRDKERLFGTDSIIFRWLIYPFGSDRTKKVHPLPLDGPSWSWGAFVIPELWFLYNGAWGVFLLTPPLYIALFYLAAQAYIESFGWDLLYYWLGLRVIAGMYGSKVYYARHGKWPQSSWNQATEPREPGAA